MAKAIPEVILSCGNDILAMPVIGMGTAYPAADPETDKAAVLEAIKAGYRHFDTALVYGSEKYLGQAISDAVRLGLIKSRSEVFITTKLFASFAEKDLVVPALNMSLRNLQLEYVDMYIIHWPFKFGGEVKSMPVAKEMVLPLDLKSVWGGMEECKRLGLARGIGVSNFTCNMLQDLLSISKIPPVLNQLEMSPAWQTKKLNDFCKAKGIHVTAYSPLGGANSRVGDDRVLCSNILEDIAKAKGKTTAQVSLRWVYEQGVSMITKSNNKERMKQNVDIFDWSLTDEELEKISHFPQRKAVTFASIVGPHDLIVDIDAQL
ncbi:PREDICTED: D-galacturonate reductase-like [Prunus mume]|uniref:D-galacturonate reductase-like n=1 Tax=Prunus mume TaxID=102107 RepID=A0ABM0N887_PRUMU|nr:PREDICTED: D-galacturonate reductase-like [Prunus mume]